MKLVTIYYSEEQDAIMLLLRKESGIYVQVVFEKSKALFPEHQLQDFILRKKYQLIGAFYEN
jgi:hypothetical protein